MKKWVLIFVCILSATAQAQPVIDAIRLKGDFNVSKVLIRRFLPVQEGDPFTPEQLAQAIDYLDSWGIFELVEAKTETVPDGVVLTFHLIEGKIVSFINLTGHYPYIEVKIRKRLNLQVGDTLTSQKIAEQKKRITSFFNRMGFYETKVHVVTRPDFRANHVRVHFHINKGYRIRIGSIAFQGNRSIPSAGLYQFIKPMDLYSERRLKNALEEMARHYRDRGFLKAKARIRKLDIDAARHRAHLFVEINEGPRVQILFRGALHYRPATLKEIVTLYREGNFDRVELELSAQALRERFAQDGYPDAQVTFRSEKINPDYTRVLFHIQPGQRFLIHRITLPGAEQLSEGTVKKHLLNQQHSLTQTGVLQAALLKDDRKIAKEVYQSRGFLYAKVGKPEITLTPSQTGYRVAFPVTEGPQVMVRSISFAGLEPLSEDALRKELVHQTGKPFNKPILPDERELVERFLKNHGHPYAEVKQKIETIDQTAVTIHYVIEKGPPVKIGDVLHVGDVLTGLRPLKQTMELQPGDPYSEQKIVQSELNLRRLGTFQTVRIQPLGLETQAETIPLIVRVEERRPFVLDLETRFTTDQQYSGTMLFTNYNSFGWAKHTRLALTAGLEKNRAELSWLDPRFVGSDIQMSLASWLDYEKEPTETSVQSGGALGFFRQYRRFGFLTRYQLTRTLVVEGDSVDPDTLRDSTLSEIGLSGSYDRRNNFADPSQGFYTLIGGQIFNEIKGQRADFAKLKSVHTHFLSPFSFLTFASTLRVNRTQNLVRAASIPQRELFDLGGDDTIRGFKEDRAGPLAGDGTPLGGRTRILFNEEMLLRLGPAFQAAIFYDGGTLTEGFDDIDLNTYRNAYGFGLRYITPVGPIRADYGIIIDRQPGENFGRFHLTFGYLF